MTVEELFKKVRRTVVQWTKNVQIPWEHTSLITNFSFNAAQMVASPQIPYKENVVRDAEYNEIGEIADLINEIKFCDYDRQNPAIEKILKKRQQILTRINSLFLEEIFSKLQVGHLVPKIYEFIVNEFAQVQMCQWR